MAAPARHELGSLPQTCRLDPIMKHTGQESDGELCEISNFDRFCTKSGNNVSANCFSFWGTYSLPDLITGVSLRSHSRASPLDPLGEWELPSPGPLGYTPK